MTQPQPNQSMDGPLQSEADIITFKIPKGAEELNPAEFTLAECVSFFIHKWSHPGFTSRPIADVINENVTIGDDGDAWQKRLGEAIDRSPLFDHYDEILEADPITRLLDTLLRSTISDDQKMATERKAMRSLLSMRGTVVVPNPSLDITTSLEQLPTGDEEVWQTLLERLASQK